MIPYELIFIVIFALIVVGTVLAITKQSEPVLPTRFW